MVLQDITDWIRSTCAGMPLLVTASRLADSHLELAPGEMIKPSSLQLLDAMNAVEVRRDAFKVDDSSGWT